MHPGVWHSLGILFPSYLNQHQVGYNAMRGGVFQSWRKEPASHGEVR